MTGSRHDRSIANLPLTSFENTFNDDELLPSSKLNVDILDESISIRATDAFDVPFNAPPNIRLRILDKQTT